MGFWESKFRSDPAASGFLITDHIVVRTSISLIIHASKIGVCVFSSTSWVNFYHSLGEHYSLMCWSWSFLLNDYQCAMWGTVTSLTGVLFIKSYSSKLRALRVPVMETLQLSTWGTKSWFMFFKLHDSGVAEPMPNFFSFHSFSTSWCSQKIKVEAVPPIK